MSTKQLNSQKKKVINFDEIGITEDFMFGYVMRDPERCRIFLTQILNMKIDHIEILDYQKVIDPKIDARSVRLDIYADDGKTVYNCEMQTTKASDLPKRSRYYQTQIDMNLIQKGENLNDLKQSFVIFICTFDPFGESRYIYTFENLCRENKYLSLKDGTIKIFVNTHGTKGRVTKNFKELMQYFNDASTASTATNPLINDLDKAVKEARSNEKWRHDYMTWQMYGQEKHDEGFDEGLDQGLNQGLQALVQVTFQFTSDFDKLCQIIRSTPAYADVTPEQVRKYYDPLVSENNN